MQRQIHGGITLETEKLRGNTNDSVLNEIQSGIEAEKLGDRSSAESHFRQALLKTAPGLNGITWINARNNNLSTAVPFAQAAVKLDGSNAHYLDTLAEAEFTTGDSVSALETIDRAASLDSQFKDRAEEFRRRSK